MSLTPTQIRYRKLYQDISDKVDEIEELVRSYPSSELDLANSVQYHAKLRTLRDELYYLATGLTHN